MPISSKNRGDAPKDRRNVYDRLAEARRQRKRVLETPNPANDDRPKSALPRLKPPTDFPPETAPQLSLVEWAAPYLIALAIFVMLFIYAVG